MTNFNFDQAEVVELKNDEQKQIEGGVFGIDDFLVGVAIYVACEIIDGVARYAGGERSR